MSSSWEVGARRPAHCLTAGSSTKGLNAAGSQRGDSLFHSSDMPPSDLKGSSLALVMGGKTGPSQISEDSYVFDPERGWLRCRVQGPRPRPAFGALVCNSSQSRDREGIFQGLVAGGIGQDARIVTEKYSWYLDTNESQVGPAHPRSIDRAFTPGCFRSRTDNGADANYVIASNHV